MREGVSLADARDSFLSDCEIRGLSHRTIYDYRRYLNRLTDFTTSSSRELIVGYVRQNKIGAARIAWAALRSFGAYGKEMGYWLESPSACIPSPKAIKPAHRYLTVEQVKAVYAEAARLDESPPAPSHLRLVGTGEGAGPPPPSYRLVIRLLLTGLRAAELRSLRWQDLHTDTIIVYGKGKKYRKVVLDAETCALLAQEARSGPLIITTSYWCLRRDIIALGRLAGIPFRIGLHDFRRTTFTLAIKDGMDSTHLQTLGGWADQGMLRRYAEAAMEDAALDAARRHGMASRVLG